MSGNVIITPFLPLSVFGQYARIKNNFSRGELSAGFAGNVLIIRSGIGSKNVFDAIETLKDANCANILFIGSCGGIGDTAIGDILLAEQSGAPAMKGLVTEFSGFMESKGTSFKLSRIHSVESIKDETGALMDNLEKGGFLGVDLESNVFARASASNGFRACAVLYVTDRPLKRPFTERFTPEERKRIVTARETVVRTTMEFFGSFK